MLIHIVVWKYREDVGGDVRSKHVESLKALKGLVSGIHRFEIGTDVLHLDRSYHTGLVIAFEDRDALDAYTLHPEHMKVAGMGKEISAHVASVDFIV
ncbi:MAG: Dabb family protein [Acidobacteria bacterium]|nr:MAG: Dabb family protein [Acidobacteriota bacterium]REK02888.1 MAG: Dabb family protein [Acidobacteriota bacterium]REK13308.1 MAG: Dabb family protein [Acidobacteriota bacterium]REK41302.1 MAG: Dabb family protein [Acidobacteriota bacterium]